MACMSFRSGLARCALILTNLALDKFRPNYKTKGKSAPIEVTLAIGFYIAPKAIVPKVRNQRFKCQWCRVFLFVVLLHFVHLRNQT